jgi:uncharacterized protein (TIGR04255 family)
MNTDVGPSFRNPPVVETALSIQFDELRGFRTTHFGEYYLTVKDKFPIVVDQPRIEPVIESFPAMRRMPVLRIAPAGAQTGRVWFRDAVDGSMMLQLQPDRFAFNWCRTDGEEYPRYATNQPKLFEEFDRFCEFATRQELGDVKPNLCEATYVNHIRPIENESATECFSAVFAGINWQSSDGWLPQPPDVAALNRVYTIGEQKGRLYAEAGIATDKEKGEFVGLKITARVIHIDGDDLRENLDLAHRWVVKSFVSLTEEQARSERWEQQS